MDEADQLQGADEVHDLLKAIEREIQDLEQRLEDLKAQLPAHSIPPAMMIELDDLEVRLQAAHAITEQEAIKSTRFREPGAFWGSNNCSINCCRPASDDSGGTG